MPLRRPYARLVAPGIALLGDAACQVYSTHGSGIGMGLVAARILADCIVSAITRRIDPGGRSALWEYAATFHRRWGGLLCSADAFRRFSQTLHPGDIDRLLGHGILTRQMVADGLAQRSARINLAQLPGQLRGASRAGDLIRRLGPVLARMPAIESVAATYPSRDRGHVEVDIYRYERRMRWLVDSVG